MDFAERIRQFDHSVTALVLDGRGLADLGVVRSLGRTGTSVWLAAPSSRALAAASRYVTRRVLVPAVERDPEHYVRTLASWCAQQSRRLVLFCTGDVTTEAVSTHRRLFPHNVVHHLADSDLVSTCLSKSRFAALAERYALPVPHTRSCADPEAFAVALEELGTPVFIKPDNRHQLWIRDPDTRQAVRGCKGFLVADVDHVPRVVLESCAQGYRWVVQEYVPGGEAGLLSVHAYRSRSGVRTQTFVGQKLRTAPPLNGVGVLVRSHTDRPAAALATRILSDIDYRGYALLQFKRNADTGRLLLMEINPRYSTWCELAERAGVNLPACALLDHHDALDDLATLQQKDELYWWDTSGDLSNLRRKNGGWQQRLACLRVPPRWPGFARLRSDDPRPVFARFSWATRPGSWERATV